MSKPERVCLGAFAGVHGVRGLLRVKPFTDAGEDIAAYGPVEDEAGKRNFRLTIKGRAKDMMLVQVDGITDRDQAQALKGIAFYVPRERLPEVEDDEFYHADLVGLTVELVDGTPLGRIKSMQDFGAGDLVEVEVSGGETVLLPFDATSVPEVDIAGGRMVVDPPVGLLDDDEDEHEDEKEDGDETD